MPFLCTCRRVYAALEMAAMPSLREVCHRFPVVVIDAASDRVHVGLLSGAGSGHWDSSADESGVGIFECLRRLGVHPGEVQCWVYCDGPGSILGIRTVAMALRTWCVLQPRPVFAYTSLALLAHTLARPEVGVIADARRGTWHHYHPTTGLRRVTAERLTGNLAMPDGFRCWADPPPNVIRVPYAPAEWLSRWWSADLLRPSAAPDAFLHDEPSYVTWTPHIHRAPAR